MMLKNTSGSNVAKSPTENRKTLKIIGGKMMLKNTSGSKVAESPTENRKALKMIGGKMMFWVKCD